MHYHTGQEIKYFLFHTPNHKIKSFNISAMQVKGISKCVNLWNNLHPVKWYIIECSWELVLSGWLSRKLGVIDFKPVLKLFQVIKIDSQEKMNFKKY